MFNMSVEIDCIKVCNREDFDKVETLWKRLQNGKDMTVFQSIEWNKLLFDEWNRYRYNKLFSYVEIYVVICERYKMIVPLLVQERTTNVRGWIGRREGLYLLGQGSYSDYLNFIYSELSEEVISFFLQFIKKKYSRLVLYLYDMRENTTLCNYLISHYVNISEDVAISIKVVQKPEKFNEMISKHTRQNLRTALNRMNKDDMQYRWEQYGIINDEEMLNNLLLIHIKRMKTKNSSNKNLLYKLSAFIRTRLIIYREKHNNIVRNSMVTLENSCTVVVRLKGIIVGYIYGLIDKDGVIRIMQNCVDENYRFYSPMFRGIYDFILDCSIKDEIREIDFTRGDEEYKYKLGGVETKLYNFEL